MRRTDAENCGTELAAPMLENGCFGGAVAVVVGVASDTGRAIALALAAEGVDLALIDVDRRGAEAVAAAVVGLGRSVAVFGVDASDPEVLDSLCEEIIAGLGPIDIVVNNGGGSLGQALSDALGRDEQLHLDWAWVRSVSIDSVIAACRAFGPRLRAVSAGHVVNVVMGSGWPSAGDEAAGLVGPGPEGAAACFCEADTAAVVAYGAHLRREWRSSGVGVSSVVLSAPTVAPEAVARAVCHAIEADLASLGVDVDEVGSTSSTTSDNAPQQRARI